MENSVIRHTVAQRLFGELDDSWTRRPAAEAVSLAVFAAEMEARRSGARDPLVAWSDGAALGLDTLGSIGEMVRDAPTLGQALRYFAEGFALLQSNTELSLVIDAERTRIGYRILDPEIWPRRGDAELTLSLIRTICLRFGVPGHAILSLGFEHPPDRDPSGLARRTGCAPAFGGADNSISLPTRLLANGPAERPGGAGRAGSRLTDRDVLRQQLSQRLRALPTADLVRERVLHHIGRHHLSQRRIASELGLSERSLRRALSRENVTFREILEGCRRATATAMLSRTRLELGQIALCLGYSDQTAFSRAFSHWFGISPSQFRANPGGAACPDP